MKWYLAARRHWLADDANVRMTQPLSRGRTSGKMSHPGHAGQHPRHHQSATTSLVISYRFFLNSRNLILSDIENSYSNNKISGKYSFYVDLQAFFQLSIYLVLNCDNLVIKHWIGVWQPWWLYSHTTAIRVIPGSLSEWNSAPLYNHLLRFMMTMTMMMKQIWKWLSFE